MTVSLDPPRSLSRLRSVRDTSTRHNEAAPRRRGRIFTAIMLVMLMAASLVLVDAGEADAQPAVNQVAEAEQVIDAHIRALKRSRNADDIALLRELRALDRELTALRRAGQTQVSESVLWQLHALAAEYPGRYLELDAIDTPLPKVIDPFGPQPSIFDDFVTDPTWTPLQGWVEKLKWDVEHDAHVGPVVVPDAAPTPDPPAPVADPTPAPPAPTPDPAPPVADEAVQPAVNQVKEAMKAVQGHMSELKRSRNADDRALYQELRELYRELRLLDRAGQTNVPEDLLWKLHALAGEYPRHYLDLDVVDVPLPDPRDPFAPPRSMFDDFRENPAWTPLEALVEKLKWDHAGELDHKDRAPVDDTPTWPADPAPTPDLPGLEVPEPDPVPADPDPSQSCEEQYYDAVFGDNVDDYPAYLECVHASFELAP